MLTNMEIFLVALAAVAGALGAGLLGWLDSGETFEWRKFTSTMLRAFFAGLVFAAANFAFKESIVPWDYITAIIGGVGIDVLGNRAAGAIASRKTTTPTTPTPSPAPTT